MLVTRLLVLGLALLTLAISMLLMNAAQVGIAQLAPVFAGCAVAFLVLWRPAISRSSRKLAAGACACLAGGIGMSTAICAGEGRDKAATVLALLLVIALFLAVKAIRQSRLSRRANPWSNYLPDDFA